MVGAVLVVFVNVRGNFLKAVASVRFAEDVGADCFSRMVSGLSTAFNPQYFLGPSRSYLLTNT